MKKFTANYAHTNSNFVIQNLKQAVVDHPIVPLIQVLKNVLMRGTPTILSRFLQQRFGRLHELDDFKDAFALISPTPQKWIATIKGDEVNRYFPARQFLEEIVPKEFGRYAFVQALLIPELSIEEIVGEPATTFTHQEVDFFLPQARLVIEIDGQQHKANPIVAAGDAERNGFLAGKGIRTIRITTAEMKSGAYKSKVVEILAHLESYEAVLAPYRKSLETFELSDSIGEIWERKLTPTAIIRFQILLLELLLNGSLSLDVPWRIELRRHDDFEGFPTLAIQDLQIWLGKLWRLQFKTELKFPSFEVNEIGPLADFGTLKDALSIDFSIFQRYTDACKAELAVVFVRTDYFDDANRNYFKVSCAEPINYRITKDDEEALAYFLRNIFDKDSFRDGQFPILSNALNLRDTIGLLPTGGGKSLCYQLPCLLQPSVNFVVCPIKSLMKDQADNLANALITNVAYISSDLTPIARRKAELDFGEGKFLFAFISPERLQIEEFREKILAIQATSTMAYAVIDEVHCLSEWGHSFRTSYLNLAKTIDRLSPKDANGEGRTKFIGLTATASVNVLKDIKVEFSRQKGQLLDEDIKSLLDYSRKELTFQVLEVGDHKFATMQNILENLGTKESLFSTDEKAALIFTPNVNGPFGCKYVSDSLNANFHLKCNWYSGKVPTEPAIGAGGHPIGDPIPIMSKEEFKEHKEVVQRDFKDSKFPMMVATKAFGMGIDKSNIQYTFHYGLPSSVEALYQEAGRAGRWDKRSKGNASRAAICNVLYSKELVDPQTLQRIFQIDTTFSELATIADTVGFDGKDIFRQLFLFIQGQDDIEQELENTLNVFRKYFKNGETIPIFYENAWNELRISSDTLQKAIYRLSLLGVVTDWSTDFINQYTVSFGDPDTEGIVQSVAKYINKYEPSRKVVEEIMGDKAGPMLEHALRYLLKWIFENITYNRKQSLKTLVDFCNDFHDSESFKLRLDNYFKFTEWTFILQHIAENPSDYEKWFEVLTLIERDTQNVETNRIYLPEITNLEARRVRFESLRDGISRFLESYRSNPGMNLLSGLSRLFLDEYEDSDGKSRFEDAMRQIKEEYEVSGQEFILSQLVNIAKNLILDRKEDICRSIIISFPEQSERIAMELELGEILKEFLKPRIKRLRSINQQLYEQLGKI